MEEISDHAKNLTLSDDLEKPLEERVNLFYSFVKVSLFGLLVGVKSYFKSIGSKSSFTCVIVITWYWRGGYLSADIPV